LVAAFGIGSSLVVIAADWLLKRYLGLNFPSVMHWLILPTGALATGAAAASGYYLGAKLLHQMPSRRLAFNMVAIGFSTWALIHWTDYRTATFSDTGTRISDSHTFLEFIRLRAESMSFRVGGGPTSTGPVGSLGEWIMAWQFLAFLLGGAAVYFILRAERACPQCHKYYKRCYLLTGVDGSAFNSYLDTTQLSLPNLGTHVSEALGSRSFRGLSLAIDRCPACATSQLVVELLHGRDASDVVAVYSCSTELAASLTAK